MISESVGIKPRPLHIRARKKARAASTHQLDRAIQIRQPLTQRPAEDTGCPAYAGRDEEKHGFCVSRRAAPELWRSEGRAAACTRAACAKRIA